MSTDCNLKLPVIQEMVGRLREYVIRVLRAERGEVVKITIVNGETLVHDLVLEQLGLRTDIIVDEGAASSITFTAKESDTYFTAFRATGRRGWKGSLRWWNQSGEPRLPKG